MSKKMKRSAVRALALGAAVVLVGCAGGGSEPLRRIEALEARVERLEQAMLAGSSAQGVTSAIGPDSVP